MISDGKYRARATGQVVLGKSKEKGTPFIELYFVITEGPNVGGEIRWSGYFSDGKCGKVTVAERTIQSLQMCGWQGDDLSEFEDGDLHGLDANEVQIVVELEEYESEGETRTTPRVAWVNRLGGFLNVDNAMSKEQASSFGDRMKGLVLKMRSKNGAPTTTTDKAADFPHGANAEPKPTGTARKGW